MSWLFQRPAAAHLAAVRDLLVTAELPSEDVAEHLDHFLVVWDGERLAGIVGMEMRDSGGLLRSLAVDKVYRGTGLGKALTREILSYAGSKGIANVGLLTTTAEKFFAKLGFKSIPREEIPDWIKASREYTVYCPSTAVCMLKRVTQ
ncbi:MAG: arsenic resistance N-acetyltransferase ArsN2 [Bacteroidota bacterium]